MITKSFFDKMPDGRDVYAYTLTNANNASVKLLSLGGRINELNIPDKNGVLADVVCGFDNVSAYLGDKETLSEALIEHGLIEGENDIYGMYVKRVNGITQDYNKDRTYWALYIDGVYSMEGVSSVRITDGASYTYKAETY